MSPRIKRHVFCYAMLAASWLLAAGCLKSEYERPKEAFFFEGHVTDCASGKPVAGAAIRVKAVHGTFVVNSDDEVGTAWTDGNGYYKIYPATTNVFSGGHVEYYSICCASDVSVALQQDIDNDSVRKGRQSFRFDFSLFKTATLNVRLYNTQHGTADILKFEPVSSGVRPSCYLQPHYLSYSVRTGFDGNRQTATGDCQDDTVRATVVGDQVFTIRFTVERHNIKSLRTQDVYCPANGTTTTQLYY